MIRKEQPMWNPESDDRAVAELEGLLAKAAQEDGKSTAPEYVMRHALTEGLAGLSGDAAKTLAEKLGEKIKDVRPEGFDPGILLRRFAGNESPEAEEARYKELQNGGESLADILIGSGGVETANSDNLRKMAQKRISHGEIKLAGPFIDSLTALRSPLAAYFRSWTDCLIKLRRRKILAELNKSEGQIVFRSPLNPVEEMGSPEQGISDIGTPHVSPQIFQMHDQLIEYSGFRANILASFAGMNSPSDDERVKNIIDYSDPSDHRSYAMERLSKADFPKGSITSLDNDCMQAQMNLSGSVPGVDVRSEYEKFKQLLSVKSDDQVLNGLLQGLVGLEFDDDQGIRASFFAKHRRIQTPYDFMHAGRIYKSLGGVNSSWGWIQRESGMRTLQELRERNPNVALPTDLADGIAGSLAGIDTERKWRMLWSHQLNAEATFKGLIDGINGRIVACVRAQKSV